MTSFQKPHNSESYAPHTSREYEYELARARELVLQMGLRVERQLVDAVECLSSGFEALIDEVLGQEHVVNALERAIDECCGQFIARRQPAAGDLRELIAFLKTSTDLERVGDEAKKIALRARKIAADDAGLLLPRYVDIRDMARAVRAMLREAFTALERRSVDGTAALLRRDEGVNEAFRDVLRQLVGFMLRDPRTIGACLDIVFVAKALERVGDHAKNIAEHIIYLVMGKDLRRLPLVELERARRAPE